MNFITELGNSLYSTFVLDNRWQWFLSGLGYTLLISFFAVLVGLVIGVVMAFGRLSKNKLFRGISGLYIDIIRGTPTTVQLLIMWSGILATCKNSVLIASLTFGINSGAYVAEIVRAGILAVDKGQTEAGRSLGLTQRQTMTYIIIPQAVKNILPALGNEFIVLIKETAVIGMIANIDLVGAARKVQSLTYDYVVPMLSIALIYYVVIKIVSTLLKAFENKLRKSDIR